MLYLFQEHPRLRLRRICQEGGRSSPKGSRRHTVELFPFISWHHASMPLSALSCRFCLLRSLLVLLAKLHCKPVTDQAPDSVLASSQNLQTLDNPELHLGIAREPSRSVLPIFQL